MTIQEFLKANNVPYVAGSPTSQAAAKGNRKRAAYQRAAVLEALTKAGENGLTDEEGYESLNMNPSSWRPRRVELVRDGLIKSGGVRATKSSRMAVVWRLVK